MFAIFDINQNHANLLLRLGRSYLTSMKILMGPSKKALDIIKQLKLMAKGAAQLKPT